MTDGACSALVLGGGSGIGAAVARRLSQAHAVVVSDLRASEATRVAEELRAGTSMTVASMGVDVRQPDELLAAFRLARSLGPLHIVVNTAGLSPTMANGRDIIEVNLGGALTVIGLAGDMVEPDGVVVLIASVAGHLFREALTPQAEVLATGTVPDVVQALERLALEDPAAEAQYGYAMSKLAVILAVEQHARRLGERGVRLVSVSPGMIGDTPMGTRERARQPRMDGMISASALRRYGKADDIASAVEFLCSPAAAYVTGTDIRVDGGTTPAVIQAAKASGAILQP